MPLEIPNLDDRNYTELVEEARSIIPQYAPDWTNHNPSDPGITLIELLAYISEILIYRLNRVTRDSRIKFLQLLRPVEPAEKSRLKDSDTPLADIDEALRQAVLNLRHLQRAVTAQDYEKLIKKLTYAPEQSKIVRSKCFSGMNLKSFKNDSVECDNPGHVSVVIVPDGEHEPEKMGSLLQYVRDELEPMRLLTTRLHIVPPFYLYLSLGVEIGIQPDADFDRVRSAAIKKMRKYFNPLPDENLNGEGWPFGRPIYLSEVYAQVEEVSGIDYVRNVSVLHLSQNSDAIDEDHTAVGIQIGVPSASTVGVNTRIGGETSGAAKRLIRDTRGRLIVVEVRPYELVKIVVHAENILPATVRKKTFSIKSRMDGC